MAHQSRRGFVHVIVHSARGLPASDFAVLKKPSSDPYCILEFAGTSHNTRTIPEELNPAWEEAFSFQIGSFLPSALLALVGEVQSHVVAVDQTEAESSSKLKVRVLDEDQFSEDDPLGHAHVDLQEVFCEPRMWLQRDLCLTPPPKVSQVGKVQLSLCWEPAPLLPPYLLRICAVICFATAFALLIVAASCRWQPGTVHEGALKQPGVGAATALAAVVLLLATVINFVVAHMNHGVHLDKLAAEHGASSQIGAALSAFGDPRLTEGHSGGLGNSVLTILARPYKLAQYELTVTPTLDVLRPVYLPVVILAWLLPGAGAALTCLGLLLQMQDLMFYLLAGELCALLALSATAAGYVFTLSAVSQPKSQKNLKHHLDKRRSTISAMDQRRNSQSTNMSSSGADGRVRKRDFFKHFGKSSSP